MGGGAGQTVYVWRVHGSECPVLCVQLCFVVCMGLWDLECATGSVPVCA